MRPKLIEDPVFLRYYERWQKEPASVVFAAISEIFRTHNMLDEAVQVAIEGLKHHPDLISGHLALAKAFLAKGERLRAKDEAVTILGLMPSNIEAIALLELAGEGGAVSGDVPTVIPNVCHLNESGDLAHLNALNSRWSLLPNDLIGGGNDKNLGTTSAYTASDEEDITEEISMAELENEPERGSVSDHEAWHTLTMAQILTRQGHFARARKIFRKILDREPDNEVARAELDKLDI